MWHDPIRPVTLVLWTCGLLIFTTCAGPGASGLFLPVHSLPAGSSWVLTGAWDEADFHRKLRAVTQDVPAGIPTSSPPLAPNGAGTPKSSPPLAQIGPVIPKSSPPLAQVGPGIRNSLPPLAQIGSGIPKSSPPLPQIGPGIPNSLPPLAQIGPGIPNSLPPLAQVGPGLPNRPPPTAQSGVGAPSASVSRLPAPAPGGLVLPAPSPGHGPAPAPGPAKTEVARPPTPALTKLADATPANVANQAVEALKGQQIGQGNSTVELFAMGPGLWPWTPNDTAAFQDGMEEYFAEYTTVGNFSVVLVEPITQANAFDAAGALNITVQQALSPNVVHIQMTSEYSGIEGYGMTLRKLYSLNAGVRNNALRAAMAESGLVVNDIILYDIHISAQNAEGGRLAPAASPPIALAAVSTAGSAAVPGPVPSITIENTLDGEGSITAYFIAQGPVLLPWPPEKSAQFMAGMQSYFKGVSQVNNITVLAVTPIPPEMRLEGALYLNSSLQEVMTQNVGLISVSFGASGWIGFGNILHKLAPLASDLGQPTILKAMQAAGLQLNHLILYSYEYAGNGSGPAPAPAPPPGPSPVQASVRVAGRMPPNRGGSGLSVGAIAGIVVGGVGMGGLCFALPFFILWKRRTKDRTSPAPLSTPLKVTPVSWPASTGNGSGGLPNGQTNGVGTAHGSGPNFMSRSSKPDVESGPLDHDLTFLDTSPSGFSDVSSSEMRNGGSAVWEINPDELKYATLPDGEPWLLGTGAYGKVYKATWGVQSVAVKELCCTSEKQMLAFRREVAILQNLRDANIVQFLGACLRTERPLLVTEFMQGGNLYNAIERDRNGVLLYYNRGRRIAMDIARGLYKMHSRRIIHLDIKSPNILLTGSGLAKIADVGVSKFMKNEQTNLSSLVGTFEWAAPEVINGQACWEAADCYSYGVVLWEIVTGEHPVRRQFREVSVPDECPEEIRLLIRRCLTSIPQDRPCSEDIYRALESSPATLKDCPT